MLFGFTWRSLLRRIGPGCGAEPGPGRQQAGPGLPLPVQHQVGAGLVRQLPHPAHRQHNLGLKHKQTFLLLPQALTALTCRVCLPNAIIMSCWCEGGPSKPCLSVSCSGTLPHHRNLYLTVTSPDTGPGPGPGEGQARRSKEKESTESDEQKSSSSAEAKSSSSGDGRGGRAWLGGGPGRAGGGPGKAGQHRRNSYTECCSSDGFTRQQRHHTRVGGRGRLDQTARQPPDSRLEHSARLRCFQSFSPSSRRVAPCVHLCINILSKLGSDCSLPVCLPGGLS